MSAFGLRLRTLLQSIQSKLAFEDWLKYPQFSTKMGLGRVALLSCTLSTLWGTHAILIFVIMLNLNGFIEQTIVGHDRLQLLLQWCLYVCVLCTFHLLEFFVTAFYNPYVTSSDSFLINHSMAYTAAALLSWMEFWIHYWCFPHFQTARYQMTLIGVVIVTCAQCIRTCAMATCGESFNHLIQVAKKENHVLITHGIYKIFRHPSYVGFFYWSIATQLVLGNVVHTVLYAIATWLFFSRRIPYEEEALQQLFPQEYPEYMRQTIIGIPFLSTAPS